MKNTNIVGRDISPQDLAQEIKVPKEQIRWICEERGDITHDFGYSLTYLFQQHCRILLNI